MGKAEKNKVIVRRRLRRGETFFEEVPFPPGWEVLHLPSSPAAPPLQEDDLPGPASILVPEGKVVVVVNDAQRPTPTPWLLERLALDWERSDLFVAVATGSHLPPSEAELDEMLGSFKEQARPRLVVHEAAGSETVSLGRTGRGTPIEVNRCLEGAEVVLCLGSVEPHYFAGWTGGRKSLIPGLSSLATMQGNHRLALEPASAPGRLADNPLHLDLVEGLTMVQAWLNRGKPSHLLSLSVIHCHDRFFGYGFGPLHRAVEELSDRAWEVFGRQIPYSFPLVVCFVDHPLDRDLYQAMKAFENWKSAVAPGGILVLVAKCHAGMGPPSFQQFIDPKVELGDFLLQAEKGYRLGDHKLVNLLRYQEEDKKVFLVSSGNFPSVRPPFAVFPDLSEAIQEAGQAIGVIVGRALVVEDAGHAIPVLP